VILGLPGLYFKQIDRAGLLGMIGFIVSFVGFLFLAGIQTFDAFVSPTLAASAATKSLAGTGTFLPLLAFELLCGLLLIIGPLLFGIATLRAGVLQRWAAIILIVGSVASMITVALHNWNEISGAILNLAFACFGFLLLSKQGTAEVVSSPSVLAFLIFIVGVWLDFAQFRTVCTVTACADGQLNLESARTLQLLHLSLDAYAAINVILLLIQASVYYGVAALIFRQKSDQWIGVCVVVCFLAGPTNSLDQPMAALPPAGLAVLTFVQYLGVATFILTCYLFPNGRFIPRWTLLIAPGALVIAAFQAFLPNIEWPSGPAGLNWVIGFTTLALAQIYRYRKVSNIEQRQQTKWVMLGITAAAMIERRRYVPLKRSVMAKLFSALPSPNACCSTFHLYGPLQRHLKHSPN